MIVHNWPRRPWIPAQGEKHSPTRSRVRRVAVSAHLSCWAFWSRASVIHALWLRSWGGIRQSDLVSLSLHSSTWVVAHATRSSPHRSLPKGRGCRVWLNCTTRPPLLRQSRPVTSETEPATRFYGETLWLIAKILPSLSLDHAVFAPPALAMLFSILMPGMSYSSNTTPPALSSRTSATTSSTAQNKVLAFDVPAPADGYMNTHEPPPHS